MSTTDPIDEARLGLLLGDLRLPAIKAVWPRFAERADKEGWPAARLLAALAELEVAERARRRIERHLVEARLPPGPRPSTPSGSRPCRSSGKRSPGPLADPPHSPRPRSWPSSPATDGSTSTTCSSWTISPTSLRAPNGTSGSG